MSTQLKLFVVGIPLLFATALLGLSIGDINVGILDLLNGNPHARFILVHLRLPSIITAFIVGACLAVAGASFQGVFQNELADPYILGVSSGAGLGAALSIYLNLSQFSPLLIPIAALIGALASIAVVYMIVRIQYVPSKNQFILAGIIVNTFFSACMALLLYVAQHDLFSIMQWLLGDLEMANASWLTVSGISLLILSSILIYLGTPLNIVSLGDDGANALGVRVSQLRFIIFVVASCLTGLAVATAGIIGFVGLIVPHMIRLVAKDDFRWLIPLSLLYGGLFLMICDLLSKQLLPGSQLPIGVICSFIGAPFFLFLLLRRRA